MSSGRNWFFFVLGLLFSSFLGGALNVQFSPVRIRQYVEGIIAKRDPKFNLEFSGARLSLADGWSPQIAIELRDLVLRAKDPCVTANWLTADRFTIPIDPWSLFSKQLRLGEVRAGRVRFHQEPKTCSANANLPVQEEEEGIAPLERFFQRRWSKEVVNTTKYLRDFEIERLEYFRGNDGPFFYIEDTHLEFLRDQGESRIEMSFVPDARWSGGAPFGPTKIEARVSSDTILFAGRGNLKEGQFDFDLNWDVVESEIHYALRGRDLPLQNVLGFLRNWGVFPNLLAEIRNQWLTCSWVGHGRLRDKVHLKLRNQNCRAYGDLGEMSIVEAEVEPFSSAGVYPIMIEIENIPVKETLKAFGYGGTWGRVSHFGTFSGRVQVLSSQDLVMAGQLKDAEIYLANLTDRVRQKIRSMNVKFSYDEKEFSGQVDSLEIENGLLEGLMSFRVTRDGDGQFQLAFNQARLPVDSQQVLFGGRAPFVELFGMGTIEKSEFLRFQGRAGLSELETNQWKIERLKSQIELNEGVWNVVASADLFNVKPEGKWHLLANQLLAASPHLARDLNFEKIKSEFSMKDGQGAWRGLTAEHRTGQTSIFGEGAWTTKGTVNGQISAKYTNKSVQQWTLGGSFREPLLQEKPLAE